MKDSKTKRWHRVDNKIARDKVGNALRDAMKLRSSVVDKQDACVSVLRTKSKKFSSAMKKLKSGRRMSPPSSLLHVKLRTVLPSTTLSTSESSSQNSSHQATPLECFSGIILDADNTNTTPVMPTSNTTFTGRGRGLVSVFDMFDGSSNFHDLEPRPLKVFPQ